jgi:peptidoglycan hydrolase CwlO-like protein
MDKETQPESIESRLCNAKKSIAEEDEQKIQDALKSVLRKKQELEKDIKKMDNLIKDIDENGLGAIFFN